MASVRVGLGTLGFCEPKMRFILVLHRTSPHDQHRYASGFGSQNLFRARFVLGVTVKFGNILVNFTIHDLYLLFLKNTGRQETKFFTLRTD